MTPLTDACADIAAWLPRAADLIAEPDTDGTTGGGKPGSSPPWNPQAAACLFDTAEGLRRLEASFRLAVTGHCGPRRGGSDGNTRAALAAVEKLGEAVTTEAAATAARILARWATSIMQLPAVDEAEKWQRITGSRCPYCQMSMLRAQVRERKLTCLRFGSCRDGDGNHPVGRMTVSRLDGSPCIEWADGLVT